MAIKRPTFHEAWYRVADLKPRLLSNVRIYRQHFRRQLWYVLENSSNNKFSRLSQDAYFFIGLLDGHRTIADAWQICNQQQGDRAPTQGEVIQLLGQLYSSNLLYAELPPDTASLLNRYTKRVRRQFQGFFRNLLFIRIPLYDPDHLLDKWVSIVGKAFSKTGLLVWLCVILTGLFFVVGNLKELIYQSADILAPDNLFLLYLSMIIIKVCHEFGHSFACKAFGRLNGSGGQVHVMGVMFLVFVPLPYMDASSAWAFRRKRHRVIVGLSGVMVELFIAAIAAVIWANTSTGTLHIIAYNLMFIASVSTLLFNGNPLLRFDAYYVMSDLVEIPNLGHRSRQYLYYWVRKHLWKVQSAQNPAHTPGEKGWFIFYGIASTLYRIFISVRILMFLNDRLPQELFFLVPLFALSAAFSWILVPTGKFLHYLAAGSELARTRPRAIGSTLGFAAGLILLIGVLRMPDYCRIEGVVEPQDLKVVYAATDGFVKAILPSGQTIAAGHDTPVVEAVNIPLMTEEKTLLAELGLLQAKERIARTEEIAAAQMIKEQISALQEQIQRVQYEISTLRLGTDLSGTWISPNYEKMQGIYLRRGDPAGYIIPTDALLIRATAGQNLVAMLLEQHQGQVQIRPKGRPDIELTGTVDKIFPAGQEVLPSEALGYAAGGAMPTQAQDPSGRRTAEKFFEVWIKPDIDSSQRLLTGQRVIVRIKLQSKPLAVQWWLTLRQLFQRRFHI
ncbi:MAG: hypothetical protein JRC99_04845 [Deltaproteobacteria bacterium]|nr:hypothetical protein [Deltaproteobacteria bacterium]